MKKLMSKTIGAVLILAAVAQWATYAYPGIAPFWPGAAFTAGMVGQVVNWFVVCILAAAGLGFWKNWGRQTP